MAKRLFIGLELPESCQRSLAELDPGLPGVRWVAQEQMHLTMGFLDGVASEEEEQLRAALHGVHVPPFFLPIAGVGVFGGEHPTVVWAGVGKGHPHLFALHKRIQDSVLKVGLPADLRPFHPHITIGRIKGAGRTTLAPFVRQYKDAEFGMWRVEAFTLFSSLLSPSGATHLVEMRQELAA